jgi:Fe-S-cluster containining protein
MNKCLRCGNCCTRFGVCITPFDIRRIVKTTGLKPSEFADYISEPKERERKEPAILIDGKPSLLVLRRNQNNVCFFYSPSGCKAYSFRPMLCRTYPFKLEEGKLRDMRSRACIECWHPDEKSECEYEYVHDIKKYEKEIEEYKKIAEKWNAKGGGSFRKFLDSISR